MKYLLLTTILIAAISVSSCRKSCPSCNRPTEEIKQRKVQVLLKEIIDKLNLPFLPNITRKNIPRIPPVVKMLESNAMEHNMASIDTEEDNYHSKTQQIIIFPDKEHLSMAKSGQKYFSFRIVGKANSASLRIHKAKLQVYVRRKPNGNQDGPSENSTLNVYQRGFPVTHGVPKRTLIASKKLKPKRKGSWYIFKMRSLVKHWKRHPNMNLGLELEIQGDNSFYGIVQENDSSHQPFLEISVKNKKKRRQKRRAGLECGKGSREKRCCLYPLLIDFEILGPQWDFVIAPRRFMANYCSGECDDTLLPRYLHGQFVRKMTGDPDIACCAPNNTTNINLLYFENEKTVSLDLLDSVVALSCGCL